MNLPELCDPSISPNAIEKASKVRDKFLETIMGFLNGPHTPELTTEEKVKVENKIIEFLKNDTRPQFWLMLACQLDRPIVNGIISLSPMILKWSGCIKPRPAKKTKEGQTIGHAKNGRVIRSPKGLS